MLDYEDMILVRQEQIEIMEDNHLLPDYEDEPQVIYNPILAEMCRKAGIPYGK